MDEDWVVPAGIFVAIQYAAAISVSIALGFPHTPRLLEYAIIGGLVTAAGGIWLFLAKLWGLFRAGEAHPTQALLVAVKQERSRLMIAVVGIQLAVLQVASLTWLKTLMPLVIPFWADPYLADLDALIFGQDPWRYLIPLLDPARGLIDAVYAAWFPIKSLTLAAVLLSLPSFTKSRAALAYFYTVGLFGVLGEYAFSSVGPLLYDTAGFGRRFAELEPHLTPVVKTARSYLWDSYVTGGDRIGTGISAMPSVHVALAAWVALTVQSMFKPAAILGWLFFVLILVGSVYLGWHYAIDGVAGTAAAVIAWLLAGKTLSAIGDWRSRRLAHAPV